MGAFTSKRSSKILVVGLDNSGKSTIINHLKPERLRQNEQFATVGFQIEAFRYNNINFTMFDMSGAGRYRNLWEHYYSECEGIIFVIDSSDSIRLCVVKDELETLLNHREIKNRLNIPILFFANKMDTPKALTASQLAESLELPNSLTERRWNVVQSNALSGQGLEEGVKWLNTHLQ